MPQCCLNWDYLAGDDLGTPDKNMDSKIFTCNIPISSKQNSQQNATVFNRKNVYKIDVEQNIYDSC